MPDLKPGYLLSYHCGITRFQPLFSCVDHLEAGSMKSFVITLIGVGIGERLIVRARPTPLSTLDTKTKSKHRYQVLGTHNITFACQTIDCSLSTIEIITVELLQALTYSNQNFSFLSLKVIHVLTCTCTCMCTYTNMYTYMYMQVYNHVSRLSEYFSFLLHFQTS